MDFSAEHTYEAYNDRLKTKHTKCPICIMTALVKKIPNDGPCSHTEEEIQKHVALQAETLASIQKNQADSQTKKCIGSGCVVMGGTKKKSRRLMRRKSKSKIQRRGKSVKRRRH